MARICKQQMPDTDNAPVMPNASSIALRLLLWQTSTWKTTRRFRQLGTNSSATFRHSALRLAELAEAD
jgi:hypothetical protein